MVSKPEATVFDLDGTLCDVGSIRHLVLNKRKDYDGFAYMSSFCPPIEWVADKLRATYVKGETTIIVTARSDKWIELTLEWLYTNNIPYHLIRMRQNGDLRKDREVKEDILAELQENYEIVLAYDDNPAIVAMWEDHNIPVITVPGWYSDDEEETVESQVR